MRNIDLSKAWKNASTYDRYEFLKNNMEKIMDEFVGGAISEGDGQDAVRRILKNRPEIRRK